MKTIFALMILLGLAAVNAQAGDRYRPDDGNAWSDPWAYTARADRDDRNELRDRWENLPPEERAYLRQQFRERVQSLPPERREERRREIMNRWQSEREYGRRWEEDDDHAREGYGRGYEGREYRPERHEQREHGSRRGR